MQAARAESESDDEFDFDDGDADAYDFLGSPECAAVERLLQFMNAQQAEALVHLTGDGGGGHVTYKEWSAALASCAMADLARIAAVKGKEAEEKMDAPPAFPFSSLLSAFNGGSGDAAGAGAGASAAVGEPQDEAAEEAAYEASKAAALRQLEAAEAEDDEDAEFAAMMAGRG